VGSHGVASAPLRSEMPLNGVFTAAAIRRLDGSDGDGVHLLWIPPHAAGYSVDGWDIQRRKSRGELEIQCRALRRQNSTSCTGISG
jgi:hypothetical protein